MYLDTVSLAVCISLYLQIIHLGLGDTLSLQTESDSDFNGNLFYLTFCATLTAFDY